MQPRFRWVSFDVTPFLPQHWQREVMAAAKDADFHDFPITPILTREARDVSLITRGRVHADEVQEKLPWLRDLYTGEFRDLAEQAWGMPIAAATDPRYGLVLNVQRGSEMRFECHVDSNPLTGLLFCTDHANGGELVIGNDTSAWSVADVDADCTVIRPHAGHLVFLDVTQHPHYARPVRGDEEMRVLATMNFYTAESPESTRPRRLNHHLYGDPL